MWTEENFLKIKRQKMDKKYSTASHDIGKTNLGDVLMKKA
jgi:hypothetical protein